MSLHYFSCTCKYHRSLVCTLNFGRVIYTPECPATQLRPACATSTAGCILVAIKSSRDRQSPSVRAASPSRKHPCHCSDQAEAAALELIIATQRPARPGRPAIYSLSPHNPPLEQPLTVVLHVVRHAAIFPKSPSSRAPESAVQYCILLWSAASPYRRPSLLRLVASGYFSRHLETPSTSHLSAVTTAATPRHAQHAAVHSLAHTRHSTGGAKTCFG